LHKFFPEHRVIRIDRDTTRGKSSMRSMLAEIQRGDACILVGTQMLAKGHHFPNLTLVAIVDADAGLYSSDFRAVEKMGQLLLQVTGRTGRSERAGEAVIQTHFSDHPLLASLIRDGYLAFAEGLLKERKATLLPPYAHIVLLRAEATKQHLPLQFLHEVRNTAEAVKDRSAIQHLDLLGPIPAVMEKKAGRFRAQLMFQATNRNGLQAFLDECVPLLDELTLARKVRWSIDVDPSNTI
jgi:primosomal protein N' (replication factor Y)